MLSEDIAKSFTCSNAIFSNDLSRYEIFTLFIIQFFTFPFFIAVLWSAIYIQGGEKVSHNADKFASIIFIKKIALTNVVKLVTTHFAVILNCYNVIN